MNTQTHWADEARIAEQAAQWISDLQETDERRAAFFDWLRASPRHVEESLFVLALFREAAAFDKGRSNALIAEVTRMGLESGTNVVVLSPDTDTAPAGAPPSRPRAFPRGKIWMGVAATLALAALLSWLLPPPVQEYSTRAGEQQTFALEDGSVVQLNTQSRVSVRYTASGRTLRLLEGEALFTVRSDPARPFRVETGGTVVQALGTQFNVYQQPGSVQVSVIEGLVEVSGTRVAAGEQVDVSNGRAGKVRPLNAAKALAWRQRRLVFEDDTLTTIAAEFNRYNTKVRLEVDPGLAAERFTGTFDADTPLTFVRAVSANRSLDIEHDGSRIVLRGPRN